MSEREEGTTLQLDWTKLEAIGQKLDDDLKHALTGLKFTKDHLVAVKKSTKQTSVPGVFAGGDIINGGKTAVQAIVDGMQAAVEIDEYLKQTK